MNFKPRPHTLIAAHIRAIQKERGRKIFYRTFVLQIYRSCEQVCVELANVMCAIEL